jgi:ribose-phosphate pyrophosphokinase
MARGASEVLCAATHGVFSGPAIDRLKNSVISEVIVTNTLPIPADARFDKLTVLSVAPIVAAAIKAVFDDTTVSGLFDGTTA